MSPSRQCHHCGAEVRNDLIAGLCPKCLARMTLRESRIGPGREEIGDIPSEDRPRAGLEAAELGKPGTCGRVFGEYELQEEIARGGMGVVYRARQRSLNRAVAVKMLLFPGFAGPEAVARFRLEAEAAARLQHPHIVAIHEIGEEAGQPYIAMELVEGPNLEEQAIEPERAAGYLRKIAQAVHHAHQRGVLHRDLKPSNVLIDASDEPRITDFGLAKVLTSDSRLTMTGQVLGSPGYIPPEQADGKEREVGVQADVYALGAVLYHLLTRHPPFESGSVTETLERVRHSEPVAPRQLAPGVPRDLETICLKCLRKAPERRYASARELAEDLGRFLEREPILARPITAPGRLWRWCRRRPALASVGALALVLLLTLAIGGPFVANRYRDLAEEQQHLLYASELKAAYQAIEMGNMGQAVDFLRRHRPLDGQADEFTRRYLTNLCGPFLNQPVLDHGSEALYLAVTRDGRRLAAGGTLGRITVWDVASRSLLHAFDSGEEFLTGQLGFSGDGNCLVATGHGPGFSSRGLQIWDITNVRQPEPVTGDPYPAGYDGAFSRDGSRFALPTRGRLLLFEVGAIPHVIRQTGEIPCDARMARFSPDGERLVTAGWETDAVIWRVADGAQLRTFTNHAGEIHAAVFSPDGREIASAGHDDVVRLWDAASLATRLSYVQDTSPGALDFSSDGRRVASGGKDGMVKLLDVRDGSIRVLRGHSKSVHTVRFIPETSLLASGSWDQTIRLWDLEDRSLKGVLEGAKGEASPVAFSPDSRQIATMSSDGRDILLWDTASETLRSHLPHVPPDVATLLSVEEAAQADAAFSDDSGVVDDLAFSSKGTLAVARSFEINLGEDTVWRYRIELWDAPRGVVTNSFPGQAPVRFSEDGRWMAWQGTEEGTIHWCDCRTGKVRNARVDVLAQHVESMGLALYGEGGLLAANGFVTQLFGTDSGASLATLSSRAERHGPLSHLAFTPNGKRLIGAGVIGDVQVWDVPSHRLAATLRSHSSSIRSLAISPDGRTLATGAGTGRIKLWTLDHGPGQLDPTAAVRELLTLPAHPEVVVDLEFSPDGNLLASSGADGTVRLWRAR